MCLVMHRVLSIIGCAAVLFHLSAAAPYVVVLQDELQARTPTPSPSTVPYLSSSSPTPSSYPSLTPSIEPTLTPTPTSTPTPGNEPMPSNEPMSTPTPTPGNEPMPSNEPMPTPSINPYKPPFPYPAPSSGPCAIPNPPSPSCWATLNMADYIAWWQLINNAYCDSIKFGFSECFFKLSTTYTSPGCQNLDPRATCVIPQWSDFEGKEYAEHNFYVAWVLYTINSWYDDYYQALSNADALASQGVQTIVDLLDPIRTTNVALNDILSALAAGLAFIPDLGPEIGAIGEAGSEAGDDSSLISDFFNQLKTGAQQVPGLSKALFPSGTLDSQSMDWANIQSSLQAVIANLQEQLTTQLQATVNSGQNVMVMVANIEMFAGVLPPIEYLQQYLFTGLNTYIIALGLKATNAIITRQVNTNINDLASNGTSLTAPTGCGSGYTNQQTCGYYWYDEADDITYSISGTSDWTFNWTTALETFFSGSPSLTSGEFLLRNADLCVQQTGQNPPPFSLSNASITCFSPVQVCTWSLTPGDSSPFTDCDTSVEPYWKPGSYDDCPGSSDWSQRKRAALAPPSPPNQHPYQYLTIPTGYLGWGLINSSYVEDNWYVITPCGECGPDSLGTCESGSSG